MPGFYHVQLDMNHKNPWRIIEATAKGALNWVSIGADTEPAVGSQQWFMNQVTRLMEVVDAQILVQTDQLMELNVRNVALQTRIHELETTPLPAGLNPTALATAFATTMPAGTRTMARPSAQNPDAFNGTMEKIEAFLVDCQLYLTIRMVDYPEQDQQINWVLGHMTEGSVAIWRENVVNKMWAYMERPHGSTMVQPFSTPAMPTMPALPAQVANLFQKIREDFRDIDQRATRINKLCTIQQGDKKCDEHVQAFKWAALGSAYNEMALTEEFKRSLNTPIH